MQLTAQTAPDWQAIDTVCLDLDGTLLDLAYDNYLWRHLVPQRFAAARAISLDAAYADLAPRFAQREGTLDWYCNDFWARELQLDIVALHREASEHIGWLSGAREFLAQARALGKKLLLLTNAHPSSLAIKHERTGVLDHLDGAASSHEFGAPKEQPHFWNAAIARFGFDPARTLFADDSAPVLRAAQRAGVRWVYAVRRPDSRSAARVHEEFASVDRVLDLIDAQPARHPLPTGT